MRAFHLIQCCLAGAALLLTAGCPQPIEGTCGDDDGGYNVLPGSDSGVHPDAGTVTDAGWNPPGSDAGTTDGGTTDAGTLVSRADAGPFAWTTLGTGVGNEIVNAVHGTSTSNMFLASDDGVLRHSVGGTWTTVYTNPGQYPSPLNAVWVSQEGEVFGGGSGTLLHCLTPPCTTQESYTLTQLSQDISPTGGTVRDVCGLGGSVYAVGYYGSNVRVWRFDRDTSAWTVVISEVPKYGGEDCWVAESGDVFVTATGGNILRVSPLGASTFETVAGATDFTSYAFAGIGGKLYAAGNGRRVVERDDATKSWSVVYQPVNASTAIWYGLSGGAPDELYAYGDPGTSRSFLRFDGTTWKLLDNQDDRALPFSMDVYDVWAPDADTLVLAGQEWINGMVVVGTR